MSDVPQWETMSDWSRLPDVYVTSVECDRGLIWQIGACSVPMAIGPEVRLVRADLIPAMIAEAVAKEMEACAELAASYGTTPGLPDGKTGAFRKHRHQIASAIRARKGDAS